MSKLKSLYWSLAFAGACALGAVSAWYAQVKAYLVAHLPAAAHTLWPLLLAVPASILTLAAAYLIEVLLVGWPRSSLKMLLRPQATVKLDILSILTMILLPQRHLGWLLSFGLLYAVDFYAAQRATISITRLLSTWGLQILCFLLFQSFLRYWMHRLEHSVPALWALHKFHHSAEQLTILTSERQTQLAKGFEEALVLLPAGLLTLPTVAVPGAASPAFTLALIYFVYRTFIHINGYLCHSNLNSGYGWIGRWLLVSPRMHRLHHATAPAYHNKNFTFDLVIWDRLFGTYAACEPEVDVRDIRVGLHENPFNRHPTTGGVLREYFITTLVLFWQELRKGISACRPRSSARVTSA
jgi:sterol desaturase/sphingolipid hydroxylase (fatty acid hydroxylase superfamily)